MIVAQRVMLRKASGNIKRCVLMTRDHVACLKPLFHNVENVSPPLLPSGRFCATRAKSEQTALRPPDR